MCPTGELHVPSYMSFACVLLLCHGQQLLDPRVVYLFIVSAL